MIKSMTGFGRGKLTFDNREYTVEIRTVNHRYNDVTVKVPRYLIALEDPLRQFISKNISRGKTDVFVTAVSLGDTNKNIEFDVELAGAYLSGMRKIAERYQLKDDITVTTLMKFPDLIITNNEIDEDLYLKEIIECAKIALDNLNTRRETEGANLKLDIFNRLEKVSKGVDDMESRSSGLIDEYKKKLEERLKELDASQIVDENRIAAELIFYADRTSICEEITRLRSHIQSFKDIMDGNGAFGKKLDFLIQEMNREVNTIGSKANCIDITNYVVSTKNEIENIREQIQNIE